MRETFSSSLSFVHSAQSLFLNVERDDYLKLNFPIKTSAFTSNAKDSRFVAFTIWTIKHTKRTLKNFTLVVSLTSLKREKERETVVGTVRMRMMMRMCEYTRFSGGEEYVRGKTSSGKMR